MKAITLLTTASAFLCLTSCGGNGASYKPTTEDVVRGVDAAAYVIGRLIEEAK